MDNATEGQPQVEMLQQIPTIDMRGLIVPIWGVHDEDSIGYTIAKVFQENGATVPVITRRVQTAEKLATTFPDVDFANVLNPEEMDACFERLRTKYGVLNGVVFGIAGGLLHPKWLTGKWSD